MALRVRTKEEQAQALGTTEPKQAFGTTKTIDEQWQELYRTAYNSQQRTWYVDCRINKGMTPEQARKYVAANWTNREIIITPEDMHRSSVVNRLKRIKKIQYLHGMTPPWAEEVYKEARKLGILNEETQTQVNTPTPTPTPTDTGYSLAQSATAINKKIKAEGGINMKHDLLKNIIAANSELIKNHSKNVIINPNCYYWVIEYIAQESGNSFADVVEAFEELNIEALNTKVDNFVCSERKDYEPDLDKSDLFNYRIQRIKDIRNSQEGKEIELALSDVYKDRTRAIVAL